MHGRHFFLLIVSVLILTGCGRHPMRPILPDMEASTPLQSQYSQALAELNTVLQVYLPPEYPNTYYYVKPITDATGASGSAEVQDDITVLVRDAISQVHHKVRYVEQYDTSDITHLQAEIMLRQAAKLRVMPAGGLRPNADFTISGRISQFDRNLTSSSTRVSGTGEFGSGDGRTNLSGNGEMGFRSARAAIALNVYDASGVSVPGRFGASMQLEYGKNGIDLGFAILGTGFGLGAEATAMHGRQYAMQMMAELSVVQLLGRTLTIPYWRVGATSKLFHEDPLVVNEWRVFFVQMIREGLLVPFMQAQCIANGDTSVQVTGIMDEATRAAFGRFASQYGVAAYNTQRGEPSFDLFKVLESNRILDSRQASMAWGSYNRYKKGMSPVRAEALASGAIAKNTQKRNSAVAKKSKEQAPSGVTATASAKQLPVSRQQGVMASSRTVSASESVAVRSAQAAQSSRAPAPQKSVDVASSLEKLL